MRRLFRLSAGRRNAPGFEKRALLALGEMHEVFCLVLSHGTPVLESGCLFDVGSRTFRQLGAFTGYIQDAPLNLKLFHRDCVLFFKQLDWPKSAMARLVYVRVKGHPRFPEWIQTRSKRDCVRSWHDRNQEEDPGEILSVLRHPDNQPVVEKYTGSERSLSDLHDKDEPIVIFEAFPSFEAM